ncbi:MAG: hypothetical protein ACI955_000029 [Zhongshania sp.]|jgi:hypothetical protein
MHSASSSDGGNIAATTFVIFITTNGKRIAQPCVAV